MKMLPSMEGQPHAYLNLNDEAIAMQQANPRDFTDRNPLYLDPFFCQNMVNAAQKREGATWSSGGYLENRSDLWRGSYLEQFQKFIHLGVDFNVPQGTPVAAPVPMRIYKIDHDTDQDGGWGTRVIAVPLERESDPVLIFGHLSRDIRSSVNDTLSAGDIFASVGAPQENGGWYSHLHLQRLMLAEPLIFREQLHTRDRVQILLRGKQVGMSLEKLDGYAPIKYFQTEDERTELQRIYPDPMEILGKTNI